MTTIFILFLHSFLLRELDSSKIIHVHMRWQRLQDLFVRFRSRLIDITIHYEHAHEHKHEYGDEYEDEYEYVEEEEEGEEEEEEKEEKEEEEDTDNNDEPETDDSRLTI